jgi:hypothetical protein
MKVRKKYGSKSKDLGHFGGEGSDLNISAWAKKMKEYDPDGKKALKLAKKYRKK